MSDLTVFDGELREINGVKMMNGRSLAKVCGDKNIHHFNADIKKLYGISSIVELETDVIKGLFIEIYEDGNNKGKIKDIWFDQANASAVAGNYNFKYNLVVHEKFVAGSISDMEIAATMNLSQLGVLTRQVQLKERAEQEVQQVQVLLLESEEAKQAIAKKAYRQNRVLGGHIRAKHFYRRRMNKAEGTLNEITLKEHLKVTKKLRVASDEGLTVTLSDIVKTFPVLANKPPDWLESEGVECYKGRYDAVGVEQVLRKEKLKIRERKTK